MEPNQEVINNKKTWTNANLILDSEIDGTRLTTFEVTLPRIILAEVNTHKTVSKNYQSSRAIPNDRLTELCTFTPSIWWLNGKGMSPKKEANMRTSKKAEELWDKGRNFMIELSKEMADLGIHKQLTNRLLEPFMYTTGVLTGTELAFENLFKLRIDSAAQYEFQELANCILYQYNISTPEERLIHLPYAEIKDFTASELRKGIIESASRIARVSYLNIHKNKTEEENEVFFKKLIGNKHYSAVEHQGISSSILSNNIFPEVFSRNIIKNHCLSELSGNFISVVQLRKLIEVKGVTI